MSFVEVLPHGVLTEDTDVRERCGAGRLEATVMDVFAAVWASLRKLRPGKIGLARQVALVAVDVGQVLCFCREYRMTVNLNNRFFFLKLVGFWVKKLWRDSTTVVTMYILEIYNVFKYEFTMQLRTVRTTYWRKIEIILRKCRSRCRRSLQV